MTVTISETDPRSIKAIEIAAGAAQWLKCRLADGHKAYGVPSQQTPGQYHVADCRACSCPDFRRRHDACKHVLAVRLHCALARSQQAQQRRQHLRLVVA
jgi:SWIM zinc finger